MQAVNFSLSPAIIIILSAAYAVCIVFGVSVHKALKSNDPQEKLAGKVGYNLVLICAAFLAFITCLILL